MTRASIFEGSSTDRPGLAAGLMAGALVMLAVQDSIVRYAGADTTLWQFQFIRSCGNLVLLLVLARVIWGTAPKRPKRFWAVALRSLLQLSAMMFFYGGVPRLTLAEMGAGLYTYPIFVTILSVVVLREPVGLRRIGAVLAGALGAFLILQPGSAGFHWVKLMPVGAGFCYAAMVIVTRRYCRQESPVTLAFGVGLAYVAAAVTGMVVLNLFPPGAAAQEVLPYLARGWLPLTWTLVGLALVCSVLNVIANLGLTMAYQNAESSWLAPVDYCYLIFATLWGLAFFGDFPNASMLAGMGLIAAAGAFTAWRERRLKRVVQAPAVR
ncbi:MAG: DMT family transporter [Proteobacteria bacterium]|nr:DMT family transporter [Pseudomonadota bacterium]